MSLDPYVAGPNLLTVKDAFPSVQEVLAVEGFKRQNRLIAMEEEEKARQRKVQAALSRGILEGSYEGGQNYFGPAQGATPPQPSPQPPNAFLPQPTQGPLRSKVPNSFDALPYHDIYAQAIEQHGIKNAGAF